MSGTPVHLVEVTPRELPGLQDTRGESIRSMLTADHNLSVGKIRSITGYQVKANLTSAELLQSLQDLWADPVIEHGTVNQSLLDDPSFFPDAPDLAIMVGFKPGVTDNAAQAGLDGLLTLFPHHTEALVATTMTYLFWDLPTDTDGVWLAKTLHNPMIERAALAKAEHCAVATWPQLPFPERPPSMMPPSSNCLRQGSWPSISKRCWPSKPTIEIRQSNRQERRSDCRQMRRPTLN
jgi:phosphoribosylformylglycinamidine (FGAM) synthase PurS component